MNRQHLHIEPRGGSDGLGDSVRDVVKFQIEKDRRARRAHATNDVRSGGNKKFLANLERADGGRDEFRKFQCLFR